MPKPLSGPQKAAIAAKDGPQDKLAQASANRDSAASVATQDPNAAADDHLAHALHGAKLLSAIANAHENRLQQMAQAKKGKGKPSASDAG